LTRVKASTAPIRYNLPMRSLRFSLPLLSLALALAGCGPKAETAASAPAQAADGSRVIRITANDAMQFDVKEITAAPGERLTVTFTNIGKMPKQAMAHNWVLLKPMTDTDVNTFGMAASAKAPTYLPDDQAAVVAHTRLLGPGESDTVSVQVPSATGDYPFICTFPGHFAIMRGKLVVR
jgi:azurin